MLFRALKFFVSIEPIRDMIDVDEMRGGASRVVTVAERVAKDFDRI